MKFFSSALIALGLTASATALSHPHIARNIHHKRGNVQRRCKAPVSSSVVDTSATASSSSIFSSSTPVINVVTSATTTSTEAPPPPPSTTEAPPPPPSTTEAPPPPPTEAPPPPPASTSAAAPPPSGGGSCVGGFLCGTNSGDGTFFADGLGACGEVNTDSDYIVAVSHALFDNYPGTQPGQSNGAPVCNKMINVQRGSKSVTVRVTDRCEGCSETSLDFSNAAFQQIADFSEGRVPITWQWA